MRCEQNLRFCGKELSTPMDTWTDTWTHDEVLLAKILLTSSRSLGLETKPQCHMLQSPPDGQDWWSSGHKQWKKGVTVRTLSFSIFLRIWKTGCNSCVLNDSHLPLQRHLLDEFKMSRHLKLHLFAGAENDANLNICFISFHPLMALIDPDLICPSDVIAPKWSHKYILRIRSKPNIAALPSLHLN